jgi:hypothetical protein
MTTARRLADVEGPPTPVRVQRLWRATEAGRISVLSCGLYWHPIGFEARCEYRDEADLLVSQVADNPDDAKARGGSNPQWREDSSK